MFTQESRDFTIPFYQFDKSLVIQAESSGLMKACNETRC